MDSSAELPNNVEIIGDGNGANTASLLRASREQLGEDLRDIAQILRIRLRYLQAIEDGDFDALPGNAYALGFIRTYAEYMGLGGEEIVRRFKSERASVEEKPDLSFPALVPENGIPGAAVIMIGLVVAIVGYGGWYFLSANERFTTQIVQPVPASIAQRIARVTMPEKKPPNRTSSVRNTNVAVAATTSVTVQATKLQPEPSATASRVPLVQAEKPSALATTVSAPETGPATSVTSNGASTTRPLAEPSSRTVEATDVRAAEEPETTSPETLRVRPGSMQISPSTETQTESTPSVLEATGTDTANTATADPSAVDTNQAETKPIITPATTRVPAETTVAEKAQIVHVMTAGSTAPDITPAPILEPDPHQAAFDDTGPGRVPSSPIDIPAPKPASVEVTETITALPKPTTPAAAEAATTEIATTAGPSRIVVKAKLDSWIQVRDDRLNQLIMTRLLREGDQYDVPNRLGLVLLTGNAGALEFIVDGEHTPAIGPLGAVRRHVVLDADKLRSGGAVLE